MRLSDRIEHLTEMLIEQLESSVQDKYCPETQKVLDVFSKLKEHFCEHCGRNHFERYKCQCWNEE